MVSKQKPGLILKSPTVDRRLQGFLFFCCGIFAVLVFRLWTIQIYHHEEFLEKAEHNITRILPIKAKRGRILDRNGKILAHDIDYYDLYMPIRVQKGQVKPSAQESLMLLSQLIDVPYKTLEARYLEMRTNPHRKFEGTIQVCVAKDISFEKVVAILERQTEFPQEAMVFPVAVPVRHYPYNDAASHILGYVAEVSARELKLERYQGYRQGDKVGKDGIEYVYEPYLRGRDGKIGVFVDKFEIQRGRPFEMELPVQGNDIVLNLDIDLQMATENILGASRGVIVVSDPRDNTILAMASSPRFNPNTFSQEYHQLLADPHKPLYHRAIKTAYIPGSIIKVFEAFAILDGLNISENAREYCNGGYAPPGIRRVWHCWKRTGHGPMNMVDAIKHSCDVYFYKMGMRLTIDGMNDYARQFGLNRKTGIDLKGEMYAPFPTRSRSWTGGDTMNASIGQGKVSLTPIQVNTALSAIANGGTLYAPRVAHQIVSATGDVVAVMDPVVSGQIEASTRAWNAVRKGMWEVVNSWGTAWRLKQDSKLLKEKKIEVMGKTGSAEVIKNYPTNALFVCYAPSENPEIAVTIILEFAGHGGEFAVPPAQAVLETYFRDKDSNPIVLNATSEPATQRKTEL
ncbi:MAG: penicillin-binding protein 2 [bacterium]|jgi:penicillin-binding protein 2|nr:penicillin-binding protein 2 [bacterium]